MRLEILGAGILLGLAPLAAFAAVYVPRPGDVDVARTLAFCALVYSQLLFALAARSERLTLARLGLATNPYLLGAIGVSGLLQLAVVLVPFARPVFRTQAHAGWAWALLAVVSAVPFLAVELAKLILRDDCGPCRSGADVRAGAPGQRNPHPSRSAGPGDAG